MNASAQQPPDDGAPPGLLQRFAEAFEVYAWLYRDAFLRFRWKALLITVLDGVSIALGLAVLSGVVRAARAIDGGGVVTLPGGTVLLDVPAGTGYGTLAGGFLLLGAASAASLWITDRLAQALAAKYQHDGVMRALRRLAAREPADWAIGTGQSPQVIVRFCTTLAPVILNRWCTMVLQSIRPTILLGLAAVGLIAIDASSTAMLLPLLPAYLYWLVRLTVRARESDTSWREARAKFRTVLGRWQPLADEPAGVGLTELETSHAEFSRQMRDRRLIVSRTQVGNGIFFASTLAILFASSASQYGQGRESWAGLILYVVCLRFVVNGLRANTGLLMRLQLQGRLMEPYRRLVGEFPAVPVPPLGGGEQFIDGAEPSATLVLALPWKPTSLDLALAEALLPGLEASGRARPVPRSLEAPDAVVPPADERHGRWLLGLAREWQKLAPPSEGAAPAEPVEASRRVLVEWLDVAPAQLAKRAGEGPIDAVLVWDGHAWLGAGDWSWYEENWKALGAQSGDAPAEELADAEAMEPDPSSNE